MGEISSSNRKETNQTVSVAFPLYQQSPLPPGGRLKKILRLQPRAAAPKAAPGLHFFAFSPSDPVILWKMHG